MIHRAKVNKLIQRIQVFARRLERNQEFTVHRNINHFYYMQKVEELNVLREQFDETQQKLSSLALRLESEYSCIFSQWSRDLRWLQHYELNLKNSA